MAQFVEVVFNRYNDPTGALDIIIRSGELYEFLKLIQEQKTESELFEIWLHKCFDDKNFIDFKNDVLSAYNNEKVSNEKKVEIVKDSFSILDSFIPPDDFD